MTDANPPPQAPAPAPTPAAAPGKPKPGPLQVAGGCLTIIVAICILVGAVSALFGHGHGAGSGGSSTPDPQEAPQPVDATALVTAYDGNELAGDQKYKGKRYLISGTVESVGKDLMGDEFVCLVGGNPIRNVQCYLKNSDEVAKAVSLVKGQRVSIVGTVDGLMGNVDVKECEIK